MTARDETWSDHDNADPQCIAVAALGREHLVLDSEPLAQRADDPAEFTLVLVVVVNGDAANRAVQQQLEAKWVVDPLDEVSGLAGVFAAAAADRADLDVGVIRVGMPHFVMGGGGHAIEVAAVTAPPRTMTAATIQCARAGRVNAAPFQK